MSKKTAVWNKLREQAAKIILSKAIDGGLIGRFAETTIPRGNRIKKLLDKPCPYGNKWQYRNPQTGRCIFKKASQLAREDPQFGRPYKFATTQPQSNWMNEVRSVYMSDPNISYKQAMQIASARRRGQRVPVGPDNNNPPQEPLRLTYVDPQMEANNLDQWKDKPNEDIDIDERDEVKIDPALALLKEKRQKSLKAAQLGKSKRTNLKRRENPVGESEKELNDIDQSMLPIRKPLEVVELPVSAPALKLPAVGLNASLPRRSVRIAGRRKQPEENEKEEEQEEEEEDVGQGFYGNDYSEDEDDDDYY